MYSRKVVTDAVLRRIALLGLLLMLIGFILLFLQGMTVLSGAFLGAGLADFGTTLIGYMSRTTPSRDFRLVFHTASYFAMTAGIVLSALPAVIHAFPSTAGLAGVFVFILGVDVTVTERVVIGRPSSRIVSVFSGLLIAPGSILVLALALTRVYWDLLYIASLPMVTGDSVALISIARKKIMEVEVVEI